MTPVAIHNYFLFLLIKYALLYQGALFIISAHVTNKPINTYISILKS